MDEESNALLHKKTFNLVPFHHPSMKTVGSPWVYKMKKVDMKKEFEFSKTERKVGVAELIESKERDNDFVSDLRARWQALT